MNPVRIEFDERGWFAYMIYGSTFIGRGATRFDAIEALGNQFHAISLREQCAEAAANILKAGLQ